MRLCWCMASCKTCVPPLQDLCEACGPIESLELQGRGVAEVVFLTKDDAQEAYRRYHRRNLDGESVSEGVCCDESAQVRSELRNGRTPLHSCFSSCTSLQCPFPSLSLPSRPAHDMQTANRLACQWVWHTQPAYVTLFRAARLGCWLGLLSNRIALN